MLSNNFTVRQQIGTDMIYCYLDFDIFVLTVFQLLYVRFNLSFLSLTTSNPFQRHFLSLFKEVHHGTIQPKKLLEFKRKSSGDGSVVKLWIKLTMTGKNCIQK